MLSARHGIEIKNQDRRLPLSFSVSQTEEETSIITRIEQHSTYESVRLNVQRVPEVKVVNSTHLKLKREIRDYTIEDTLSQIMINARKCKEDGFTIPVVLVNTKMFYDLECHFLSQTIEFYAKKKIDFTSTSITVVESNHVINLDFECEETEKEIVIRVKELEFKEKLEKLLISIY